MEKVISLKGVSKSYAKKAVLKGVNLEIEKGKFYALLGKNGAGKSTLIKMIMKFENLDSGAGEVLGVNLDEDNGEVFNSIGFVSESINYKLGTKLDVFFTHYFPNLYKNWNQEIFTETLKHLNLNIKNASFDSLSRGQKMQLAFAAAFAIQPKLMVLDEITSVLDPNAKNYFMKKLGDFVKNGGTVLMATNIVSEVQFFADQLLLIDDGEIKVNIPLTEIPSKFIKIRKSFDEVIDIFNHEACAEVALNSDSSISYLIPSEFININDSNIQKHLDRRKITAEEVFVYFSRRGGDYNV